MWTGLLHRVGSHLLSFDTVVVLCTWVTALAGAAFTYLVQSGLVPKSFRGFLHFCFPPAILQHRSCRLDAVFVAITAVVRMPAAVMVTTIGTAELSYAALTSSFGAHPQNHETLGLWIAIMVLVVLLQDFMTFYGHYLQHRWGVLWELHKVHHSVEFLVPISNRRFHPGQAIVDNFTTLIPAGLLLGVSSYAFSLPVHDNSVIGLDAYFIANLLSFYHLRHSHIPMRYGWLERHVISPAQHQIHHSLEKRHWDRNFGLCFSWWDRMCGTIAYSVPGEQFTLGLVEENQVEYDSVLKLFLTPVYNISRMIWRGARALVFPVSPVAADSATQRVRDAT